MNWSLVKKDFMLLLKSPLTYIGVLSMVVILYITVSPYIKLYDDFQPDGETMEYYGWVYSDTGKRTVGVCITRNGSLSGK